MDFEGVIALLKSMKEFRVNDELPFNTVDYMTIDDAIEFLSAQHGVQSDGAVRCQVAGCMHDGVYSLCAEHANPPRR